jgi:hypothetical protein
MQVRQVRKSPGTVAGAIVGQIQTQTRSRRQRVRQRPCDL